MGSLRRAVVGLAFVATSAISCAALADELHSWCVTGEPLSPDGSPDPTTNEIIGQICGQPSTADCCAPDGRWSLECVQKAGDYALQIEAGDVCGRYAWDRIIGDTEMRFPRDFNLVALSGPVTGIRDVQGPIATASSLWANYFRLNHQRREETALFARMAVLRHGEVFGGVVYSSSLTTTGVTFPDGWTPGAPTEPFPIYWEGAESAMQAMSNALAAYDAVPAVKLYSTLHFDGSDAELNVFSVNASEFLSTYEYDIDVPPGASAIINVSGASPEIKYAGFRGNFATDKLLWNFPDATTLTLRSVGFPGSILAPSAAADMQNGDLRGTVVVASAYANVELYMAPFDTPKVGGCLAIDPLWSCSDDTKVDDWGRAVALDSEAGFLQINSEEYVAEDDDRISPTHRIWYSFHPAKQYPKSKPLAVFFNGGPGTATSQILFSLNTGPKTLDPQRTGAQPIAKNDIADWSEFANLLYIDSPAAGFSYPIKNPDESEPPDVGTDMDRDAAIFVQVVLRFLRHHQMLVDNNVIVVGESYGGARSILMHDHLFKYASLTDPSSPFQDTQLHADLMDYFSVVFGTQTPSAGDIATQWGHQVLIQPAVAGLEQYIQGDAWFLADSTQYGYCRAPECWTLNPEENPDTACDRYECDKPPAWRAGINNMVEQRLTTVAVLHAALGVDPRTIEWMSAAARSNAYGRHFGPRSAETLDMQDEFGELGDQDSYYVSDSVEALVHYPNARRWNSPAAGELSATQFVEGLYNGVQTFITCAHFDGETPCAGVIAALMKYSQGSGPMSEWIADVWHHGDENPFGLGRAGVMTLLYQPDYSSLQIPVAMPGYYDTGHSVSLRAPAELRADVMQWYFNSLD